MTELANFVAPEHLLVKAVSPPWFSWAIEDPVESYVIDVEACPIHYLKWPRPRASKPGLLLLHGGGAHANWWRFTAPFLAQDHPVAAMDLSGMGDSGVRDSYPAEIRAREMKAVLDHAGFGDDAFVISHSFGGFMTMRFGMDFGDRIAGAIIADTPVRRPEEDKNFPNKRRELTRRWYASFEEALSRFRLLPDQECANDFLVEFVARHSIEKGEGGWTWKFDPGAMTAQRWGEPFHEYLANMKCRTAFMYGEKSALIDETNLSYIREVLGPRAPIVGIPESHHHIMLDQPLAMVAAVRSLLASWL
ncbi:MAG: alpha/beta hydrolase [Pseudomonadota bacterium]